MGLRLRRMAQNLEPRAPSAQNLEPRTQNLGQIRLLDCFRRSVSGGLIEFSRIRGIGRAAESGAARNALIVSRPVRAAGATVKVRCPRPA